MLIYNTKNKFHFSWWRCYCVATVLKSVDRLVLLKCHTLSPWVFEIILSSCHHSSFLLLYKSILCCLSSQRSCDRGSILCPLWKSEDVRSYCWWWLCFSPCVFITSLFSSETQSKRASLRSVDAEWSLCLAIWTICTSSLFLPGIPKPRTTTDRAHTQQPPLGRPTAPATSKLPVKGLPTNLSSLSLGSNENNGDANKGEWTNTHTHTLFGGVS